MADSLEPSTPAIESDDASALLIELVDHLDAMVSYWDINQVCRFANAAYTVWFGRGREALLGKALQELLGPLYELNLPHIEAAYRGARQVFERAIPFPDGSGVRHSLTTYVPRIVNGRVVGMFVHVADVGPFKMLETALKEAKEAKEAAEDLATHDYLTGLPNKLMLRDRAEEAIARARRTGEKMYLLSVDVDNFKQINDSYGHPAGDQILVEIAARITSCMREYDTVARIGGDEFVVLAAGGQLKEGIEGLASRMLDRVRQPYQLEDQVLTPSISVGVAEFPIHGLSLPLLMATSDRALYLAKQSGRNCFRLGHSEWSPLP